jgi:hypothetical protein
MRRAERVKMMKFFFVCFSKVDVIPGRPLLPGHQLPVTGRHRFHGPAHGLADAGHGGGGRGAVAEEGEERGWEGGRG